MVGRKWIREDGIEMHQLNITMPEAIYQMLQKKRRHRLMGNSDFVRYLIEQYKDEEMI